MLYFGQTHLCFHSPIVEIESTKSRELHHDWKNWTVEQNYTGKFKLTSAPATSLKLNFSKTFLKSSSKLSSSSAFSGTYSISTFSTTYKFKKNKPTLDGLITSSNSFNHMAHKAKKKRESTHECSSCSSIKILSSFFLFNKKQIGTRTFLKRK